MSRLRKFLLFTGLFFIASCGKKVEKINWMPVLDHHSKLPYGTAIAYSTMPEYFPAARLEPLTKWFRYSSIDERMRGNYDSAALLVMLGLDYRLTDKEWLSMLQFIRSGNEAFLISSTIDDKVTRFLHLEKMYGGLEIYPVSQTGDSSPDRNCVTLHADSTKAFCYKGRFLRSYFKQDDASEAATVADSTKEEKTLAEYGNALDTSAEILGTSSGEPDFIRYRIGNGHLTLHAAPLVLSNYFLLQKGNKEYLDAIWHSFPANISKIYWNEYFRRSARKSSLSVLFKYPAIRWAMIIAAFALVLYVLFGLKRMQRIVPEIPPVENASVSFVETIGRLYFNKGNHANLAEKMVQHFLEWIRSYYYLDTSQINDAFARQLAAKSGKTDEEVNALLQRIHEIRLSSVVVTPEYLYELHASIQSFYNQQ